MRFYTETHAHYCGVDLHARTMYVCIVDAEGQICLWEDMKAEPEAFLRAIAPFREDLVVAVECIFTWYWLADLCLEEGLTFVLGHALYMKAIHGGKAKNDKIDSHKIAALLRGGMLPQAYVYPREMRSTRDLLRRRLGLVRQRGRLQAHIQNTHHQYNLPAPGARISYKANRAGVPECFEDESARKMVEADFEIIGHLDGTIRRIEAYLIRQAKVHDPQAFHRLRTIPGVGPIISLTLLYEIHDIHRFPSVQNFASYARLIKCTKSSSGHDLGTSGAKIGNVHLKWAFSEAAVLFLRKNGPGQVLAQRLRRKHKKGKALSVLAHKIGRAAYFMLLRETAFDLNRFLAA